MIRIAILWENLCQIEKMKNFAGADKCWWVRTEIAIALINAYRLTSDEKYLNDALFTLDFIKKFIIEGKDGEFISRMCK